MRFDECLPFVLTREGGYCDVPGDAGGATNYGITQKTYDVYRIALHLPQQPVKTISTPEVSAIYKRYYWDQVRASTMPEPIDLVMFDSAVQHGPRQAIKFLQRALGVGDDGVLGPATAKALNEEAIAQAQNAVWENIIAQRLDFYKTLSTKPGQLKFYNGWKNRMQALQAECEK